MRDDTENFLMLVSLMQVTSEGSVRVDLVGGTLDLEPINLILPNVVTLNVATGLKAKVTLDSQDQDGITIISADYDKEYSYPSADLTEENILYSNKFEEMKFVLQILSLFNIKSGLKITLSSGAPPGSGLGGSSAMGMTLFKALCEWKNIKLEKHSAVQMVKGVEGRILNQGIPGYQDYYPAVTGGILALRGVPGSIQVEQLYSEELSQFLESHLTLFYSGISRDSGINNWDVYKGFFDGSQQTREGLNHIAEISFEFYQQLKENNLKELLGLIGQEGEARKKLASGIVPEVIQNFQKKLDEKKLIHGLKMCGAGGGGCFIVSHDPENQSQIKDLATEFDFRCLEFKIERPLE